MTSSRLALSREHVLAHRRRAGALDERLPPGRASLERAAWAGLQDSMPRVGGEVVGTWRRANAEVAIQTWRRLSTAKRQAVEAEAESLPLAGLSGQIVVRWDG